MICVLFVDVVGEKNRVRQITNAIRSGLPMVLEQAKLGTVIVVEILSQATDRKSGSSIFASVTAPSRVCESVIIVYSAFIQETLNSAGIPIVKLGEPTRVSAQEIIAAKFIGVETGMFAEDLANLQPPRPRPATGIVRLESDTESTRHTGKVIPTWMSDLSPRGTW